jgi:hypothetical protein
LVAIRHQPQEGMPKFVIEREIAGLGGSSELELQAILREVVRHAARAWRRCAVGHSCMTAGKMHCVYSAAGEDLVREHARRGSFPADSVAQVVTVIDPTTAEAEPRRGEMIVTGP